jgi:hypothetical protein
LEYFDLEKGYKQAVELKALGPQTEEDMDDEEKNLRHLKIAEEQLELAKKNFALQKKQAKEARESQKRSEQLQEKNLMIAEKGLEQQRRMPFFLWLEDTPDFLERKAHDLCRFLFNLQYTHMQRRFSANKKALIPEGYSAEKFEAIYDILNDNTNTLYTLHYMMENHLTCMYELRNLWYMLQLLPEYKKRKIPFELAHLFFFRTKEKFYHCEAHSLQNLDDQGTSEFLDAISGCKSDPVAENLKYKMYVKYDIPETIKNKLIAMGVAVKKKCI